MEGGHYALTTGRAGEVNNGSGPLSGRVGFLPLKVNNGGGSLYLVGFLPLTRYPEYE